MSSNPTLSTSKVVRDSKSGRYITVLGAGALKGQLAIKKGVDLTKPIANQAARLSKTKKRNDVQSKL